VIPNAGAIHNHGNKKKQGERSADKNAGIKAAPQRKKLKKEKRAQEEINHQKSNKGEGSHANAKVAKPGGGS